MVRSDYNERNSEGTMRILIRRLCRSIGAVVAVLSLASVSLVGVAPADAG
jgi:hypothetical protein